ncbi:MAG: hypothetical protein ACI9Y1_002436, partial [Lentisphaeria bacterium]
MSDFLAFREELNMLSGLVYKYIRVRGAFVGTVCFTLFLSACGGSSGAGTPTVAPTPTPTVAPTPTPTVAPTPTPTVEPTPTPTLLTISGTAVANANDVVAVASLSEKTIYWVSKLSLVTKAWADIDTGSEENAVLANASVEVFKVFADKNMANDQVDIGAVTTNDQGLFEIPDLEKLTPDNSGEFYYELRISKGDLVLRSPAAPEGAGAIVNVSPETDLAAKLISGVVGVPSLDNPPLPGPDFIEALREHVIADAGGLVNDGAIALPSALDGAFDETSDAAANGIAAAGGDTEKLFKAASFDAEFKALEADTESSDDIATAYLDRVARESCDQGTGEYLPDSLAAVLGEKLNAGTTVTAADVVENFNANYAGPDVDLATAVAAFNAKLTSAGGSKDAVATVLSPLDADDQLVLSVMRDLDPASFSASTPMAMDQAFMFVQSLFPQACEPDAQLDVFGFYSDLINNLGLRNAAIARSNIYHNSGFGCNEGDGMGHFFADIRVFKAGKNVSSVVISSDDSDTTVLGGDGEESLTMNGGGSFLENWVSNTEGVCINLGKDVTYTMTVTFDDASTVVGTIDRNHPRIPEAISEVFKDGAFVAGSSDSASPTVVEVTRPLYRWTSPDTMLTNIIADASNTAISTDLEASTVAVKYTYEFSHVDTTALTVSPAPECAQVSSGRLYAVDSFIPT